MKFLDTHESGPIRRRRQRKESLEDFVPFEEIDVASLGVDPYKSTEAKPGSEEKVHVLAARYAAGLPLWHEDDCYDHTPHEEGFEEETESED